MNVQDRAVLVTGGSRGIGRAVAHACARRGARVATPDEVAHAVTFLASEGTELATAAILAMNGASYLRS